MTYAIHEHEATQVVQVYDLINELENKVILKEVRQRMSSGFSEFIVDLSELDFMNSVGLNFLISVMTSSKESGALLAVANANTQIVNLLEITKLRKMFTLTQSVEEAFQLFAQENPN